VASPLAGVEHMTRTSYDKDKPPVFILADGAPMNGT